MAHHLLIRNIGAITEVDVDLNKINVIIGPQSSGKSTICKLACYCSWVEKKICLSQAFDFFLVDNRFYTELVRFHKLESYFREDSYFEFESDTVKFSYAHSGKKLPEFKWKERYAYKRGKICYIPSERNLVSAINNWFEVKFKDNNIRNFMAEWSDARKSYSKEQPLFVLDIDAQYYYDDKMEQDLVTVEGCATLELTDTSSGLQSVIPLEVVSEYLTDYIYKEKEAVNLSVRNKEINKSLENKLYNDLFKVEQKWGDAVLLGDGDLKFFKSENDINEYLKISQQFLNSHYTRLYIEEAEQNIFPTTQIAIIYHLLQLMNLKKEHSLFLTTHSPYVLYALNNCMMAYLVKDVMPMEEQQKLKCYDSRISPQFVSAYEIQEGTLKPIQTQNNRTDREALFQQNYK